jgi:hypothetical protein
MNGLAVPVLGENLKPVIRVGALPVPMLAWMAGDCSLSTIKGKFADVFGVFVPPCTWSVIPLVEGILTVAVQVMEPVHVSRTVSPLFALEMAELIVAAEQLDGPMVMIAAWAAGETRIKLIRTIFLMA